MPGSAFPPKKVFRSRPRTSTGARALQGHRRLHSRGWPGGAEEVRRHLLRRGRRPRRSRPLSLWACACRSARASDQYANVRPSRLLPGITSPMTNAKSIDWVIVRENTEGEYSGAGRASSPRPVQRSGDGNSTFTRSGVERVHRFAFALANKPPRKHLTLVTKSNAQRHGMCCGTRSSARWRRISCGEDRPHPGRRRDHAHGAEAGRST